MARPLKEELFAASLTRSKLQVVGDPPELKKTCLIANRQGSQTSLSFFPNESAQIVLFFGRFFFFGGGSD